MVSVLLVTTRITPVLVFTDTSSVKNAGWLRTMMATRIANSTHSPATEPNATVHEVACRNAANGAKASSCPLWPTTPVSCTMIELRCAGNQVAIRRTTLGNTAASPAPMSIRAAMAMPTLGEMAITSWPSAITSIPAVMIGRAPTLSRMTPMGTCMNPYTASCSTANIDSVEASALNRWAASTPTAAREVRLVTAST